MISNALFPTTIMPDNDWWHVLWPDPGAVLRSIGVKSGINAVDLCCGDGHFTKPMCQLLQHGKTWAIDIDQNLLSQAKQECQAFSNFQAILGDARNLPELIGEPVDFVLIANTFHGVPDKAALADSIQHSLKPGGRFAIINWHYRCREDTTILDQPRGPDTALRMRPEDVQVVVEPAGFELEKVVEVGPYHYGTVFGKI